MHILAANLFDNWRTSLMELIWFSQPVVCVTAQRWAFCSCCTIYTNKLKSDHIKNRHRWYNLLLSANQSMYHLFSVDIDHCIIPICQRHLLPRRLILIYINIHRSYSLVQLIFQIIPEISDRSLPIFHRDCIRIIDELIVVEPRAFRCIYQDSFKEKENLTSLSIYFVFKSIKRW